MGYEVLDEYEKQLADCVAFWKFFLIAVICAPIILLVLFCLWR